MPEQVDYLHDAAYWRALLGRCQGVQVREMESHEEFWADWLRQDTYYTMVREKFVGAVAERFFDTRALCELLEEHRTGKINAMTKIWSFYCFILWYELYFVDPLPPTL